MDNTLNIPSIKYLLISMRIYLFFFLPTTYKKYQITKIEKKKTILLSKKNLTLLDMGGGLKQPPPWKVLKMLNFDVVMTPTMSRNIFEVI